MDFVRIKTEGLHNATSVTHNLTKKLDGKEANTMVDKIIMLLLALDILLVALNILKP